MDKRILGKKVGHELTKEQIERVTGGSDKWPRCTACEVETLTENEDGRGCKCD